MTIPAEAERALSEGLQQHRAGKVDAAASNYRRALEMAPDYADALHLMGVLELQAQRWDTASGWIEKAIALNDGAPAYHDHLAVVRRNQGRLSEAETGHRRALAIDPKFASAHNNLASTLHQAGRLGDALQSAKRALETAPKDVQIAVNAGVLFMQGRSFGGAADAFTQAVELEPNSAPLRERLGIALFRAGRAEDAEAAFREALRLAPGSTNAARWLVETLLTLERAEEAAVAAMALTLETPGDAGLQALAGVAAMRTGDIDTAEAACEAALASDGACLSAVVGLAVIAASRGDVEGAAGRYREALALDPDCVDAFGNLANFGADGGLEAADADHMARLIGRKDLPEDQRATLAFGLAKYLELHGAGEAAWDWFVTGNLLRRAHLRGIGHVFDAIRHQETLEARRRVFTPGFFAARESFGVESERPVFVVGLPRSGTTLVEQILASHPDVFGAGELRDMPVMAIRHTPTLIGSGKIYPDCIAELSAVQIVGLADAYEAKLAARAPDDALRVIDKMPFNYLHLGLIHLMYPNARIVHCRRDLRDVGLSCFTTNFADTHPWTTDLADIADYMKGYIGLMRHWRDVLPEGAMVEIDYEALIVDLEGESRKLIDAFGLEWNGACLDFHANDRVVTTASRIQVRRPIYATSVGRWRAREAELREMLARLAL
jgi:tetratricopeptide (TPR) repeat protein